MTENFKASGVYTKQAHVKIPEGMFEEEHGRQGFFAAERRNARSLRAQSRKTTTSNLIAKRLNILFLGGTGFTGPSRIAVGLIARVQFATSKFESRRLFES